MDSRTEDFFVISHAKDSRVRHRLSSHDFEVTRFGALVFDFVTTFVTTFVPFFASLFTPLDGFAFELAFAFVGALPPYVADAPSSSAIRRS